MLNKNGKMFYVKRDDGSVVVIPERHVQETMARERGWSVVGEVDLVAGVSVEAPIPPKKPEIFPNECPICGFQARNESGLRLHKRTHK